MKEKVKEQKSAWMETKRNKANVIKKTYLLILPSNVAIIEDKLFIKSSLIGVEGRKVR